MIKFLKTMMLGACLSLTAISANAALLDFGELDSGGLGVSSVSFANVTINSFGDSLFLVSPGRFNTSGLGGFCALGNGFNCEASAELICNQAVANLTFDTSGCQGGDNVLVEIFDIGGALLSSIDVAENFNVDFTPIQRQIRSHGRFRCGAPSCRRLSWIQRLCQRLLLLCWLRTLG